jgi:hypothetical protein
MKRLFIFEPECSGQAGHALNSLRQYSIFFKKELEVYCITSKLLNNKYFFKESKILNIINFNEGCFKIINLKNFTKNLFLFLFKVIYLLIFISYKRKTLNFLRVFRKILFIPRYIPDMLKFFLDIEIKNSDVIFVPSGRPHILQALAFLFLYDRNNFPQIHFRIVHPIKFRKNKDNFFKYLEIFEKNDAINKKIFFYAENNKYKKTLERFQKLDTTIFNGLSITNTSKLKNKINISFLGESNVYKGFKKIPKFIKLISKKKIFKKIQINIQILNIKKATLLSEKYLRVLSKKFKNIKILEGPLNNFEFEKELKKCDIMPLLHSSNRAKTFGSGFLYSCMGSEIIMIIPKNISNWKKLIPVRSYLEAKNINEYVAKTELIIKKLNHYKKLVKKTKVEYLKNLKKNKLIKRIVESKYN